MLSCGKMVTVFTPQKLSDLLPTTLSHEEKMQEANRLNNELFANAVAARNKSGQQKPKQRLGSVGGFVCSRTSTVTHTTPERFGLWGLGVVKQILNSKLGGPARESYKHTSIGLCR